MFKVNHDGDDFGPSVYQSYVDAMHEQSGGKIGYYFQASNRVQRGSGVGSFLSGLARPVIPVLKRVVSELSPYVIQMFRGVASDVLENPSSLRSSLRKRAGVALEGVTTRAISKLQGGKITFSSTSPRKKRSLSPDPFSSPSPKRRKTSIKKHSSKKKSSVKSKSSSRVKVAKAAAAKKPKKSKPAKKIQKKTKPSKVSRSKPKPAKRVNSGSVAKKKTKSVEKVSRRSKYSFFG